MSQEIGLCVENDIRLIFYHIPISMFSENVLSNHPDSIQDFCVTSWLPKKTHKSTGCLLCANQWNSLDNSCCSPYLRNNSFLTTLLKFIRLSLVPPRAVVTPEQVVPVLVWKKSDIVSIGTSKSVELLFRVNLDSCKWMSREGTVLQQENIFLFFFWGHSFSHHAQTTASHTYSKLRWILLGFRRLFISRIVHIYMEP